MSRTFANNTLLGLAMALALSVAQTAAASTGTGGASAPSNPPAVKGAHASHSALRARSTTLHGTQIATWFGPGFYGQKTACGQTMTPVIVGVASRTLPCGTLVLVNYKGHRLTVPVIDRGPYAHNGAMWDLTWGAASALTIAETVRVKTKIVGSLPNSPLLGVPAEVQPVLPPGAAGSGGTVAS
jgi:rare lipoprotein A (peptidoglycan hydrolase)